MSTRRRRSGRLPVVVLLRGVTEGGTLEVLTTEEDMAETCRRLDDVSRIPIRWTARRVHTSNVHTATS